MQKNISSHKLGRVRFSSIFLNPREVLILILIYWYGEWGMHESRRPFTKIGYTQIWHYYVRLSEAEKKYITTSTKIQDWVSVLILEIIVLKFILGTWSSQVYQSSFGIWHFSTYFLKPFGQSKNLKSQDCLDFKNFTKSTGKRSLDFDRIKSKMAS